MVNQKIVLLRAFAAVMAGDLIAPYLLAPFYPGYSHRTMVMSSLGNPKSPVRGLYNCWLTVGGVVFAAGSVGYAGLYYPVSAGLSVAILVLLLLFAVGAMVLSGLFSVEETKETTSLGAKIHGFGSGIGFMALLFVPLLLAILSSMKRQVPLAVFSGLCFGLGLAAFVLFIMADKPSFKNTALDREGTWQRLTLLFLYLPILASILTAK